MAESISQTLTRRQPTGRRPWEARLSGKKRAFASIEETVSETTNSSIEATAVKPQAGRITIPPEIDALIDNKAFRNKFKGLIKRGHLGVLRELVAVAYTKEKPSHWFARATSKAEWTRSLKFVERLREVARLAEEVMNRIKVPAKSVGAVFKACWNLKATVVRHAITAAETSRDDPFKYFCWLSYKLGNEQAVA